MESEPLGIPKRDLKKFQTLPERCRREIEIWLNRVIVLDEEKPLAPAIRQFCRGRFLKPHVVHRKLELYRRNGWEGLIDRVKYPTKPAAASNENFRHFLYSLWAGNRKNYKDTHKQLLAIWKHGAPVPGYKANTNPDARHPDGWTYCNMICQIKAHLRNHPELKPAHQAVPASPNQTM